MPGKNLTIVDRWADGSYERLPTLAAELARMPVHVILAVSTPAIRAAQQATSNIPIVMVRTADPVGMGFVASLAKPGRNVTGLSNMNIDVTGKYLELIRTTVPELSRAGVLANPGTQTHADYVRRIQVAARNHGVTIIPLEAGTVGQVEAAFAVLKQERAEALIVLPDPFLYAHARLIAELAIQHRMPTMSGTREPVEAGGLRSYGQNIEEHYYRAATYVDKILKGASPADLPVEQPTKLEFVINRKTAQAIGVVIPQQLLLQADAVIGSRQ